MAGAKRELVDAVEELPEADAELVLSLVHYLRAREGRPTREGPDDSDVLGEWARDLLVLSTLQSSEADLQELRRRLQASGGRPWLAFSEEVLARDWDRPEEDEAWSHL